MRNIFPEKGGIAIDKENGNIATKQDIQDLSNQIDELTDKLNVLKSDLLEYEDGMANSVNTQAINAISGAIATLLSTSATISSISAENITASSVANLASILSQSISAANANISALRASSINSDAIEASTATIGSLTALSAEIERMNIANFSAENFDVTDTLTSDKIISNEITANDVTSENLNATDIRASSADITEIEAEGIISDEINTSNIVWKDEQVLVQSGVFYLDVPHFENGQYYFQIKNDEEPLVTVEIFNSVDNFFVRWSQKEGYLLNIYKVAEDVNSHLVFRINNIDNSQLKILSAVVSANKDIAAPSTYVENPFTPNVTYTVTYKDGQKFFKNVDLANQGSTVGTLSLRVSDLRAAASIRNDYDTTENVANIAYLPDQSVNSDDDVTFRSVESTFLDVAELEVISKFRAPNIYNGPELSSAQLEALPDESLVIQKGIEVVNAANALEIYSSTDLVKRLGSSIFDVLSGNTYEHATYRPIDGYELRDKTLANTYTQLNQIITDDYPNLDNIIIVADMNGKMYVAGKYGATNKLYWLNTTSTNKMSVGIDGTLSQGTVLLLSANCFDDVDHTIEHTAFNVGDLVYTDSALGEARQLNVIYVNASIKTYTDVSYNRALSTGGKLQRKTTKSGAVQVLPIIPTRTTYVDLDDTHPVVYDSTNDILTKSDGDITVEGDLSVKTDLDVTGDSTFNGDVAVEGTLTAKSRLSVNGDAEIDGDLYVNGTTHTVDVEEILAENNIITLRANNPLGLANGEVAGIVVNKYDGINDLSLVTDNDGTLRVGTGTGTDTSYTKIALKHQDDLYYTYDDTDPDDIQYTLLNPQPSGVMTAWTGKTEISGYTLWASATFTVIDKTSLEPVLTRDEAANISNKQILGWDAQNSKAVGIVPIPVQSRQALVSKITNGVVSYEWSSNAGGNGVAFIGTRAQYNVAKLIPEGDEGFIPSGSLVIITDEDDVITAEDR